MSGRLVLVRHGQSVLDAQKRFSGTRDPDLSERGDVEARALAAAIVMLKHDDPFDYIVSSRLVAAMRTADRIRRRVGCRHSLETADELDERDYGDLTGMTYEEASAAIGHEEVDRRAHGNYQSEGNAVAERMIDFYEARVAPHLRDKLAVLLVSYDDNLRALAARLDGKPIARETWPTGMALDYRFNDDLSVSARESMRAWSLPH